MPRINNPAQIGIRPKSVVFGELAIAAGVAGQSLTVCYDNLPAAHFCGMCRFFLRGIGAASFLHVRTQQQLRHVGKYINSLRLLLVEEPRLLSATQWTVQAAVPPGGANDSRPAIICGSAPPAVNELPGPTLELHGNQSEHDQIAAWLATLSPTCGGALEVTTPRSIHHDPAVAAIFSTPNLQLRVRHVLISLLAGAGIVSAAQGNGPRQLGLTVTLQQYETVRNILQGNIVGTCDDGFDQLCVDMVNRANVYMSIKYGDDAANPFSPSERDYQRLRQFGGSRGELITRREIADLGNTRSNLVLRIVEFLKEKENGLDDFARLGLVQRPPSQAQWQQGGAGALARYLRGWSAKQVRTHFEKLQRDGLLTSERHPSNGPWWYALPEQLSAATSAFTELPEAGHD